MNAGRQELRGIQRIVAQRMEQSNQIPTVTTIREIRMDRVVAERERLRQRHPSEKISYLTFVAMALVEAIRRYPVLNHRLENNEIVMNDCIHLGISVSIGENLIVPVIHNAEALRFWGMNERINAMIGKARENRLCRADLADGTITITNSGSIGGELFTPMINHPQGAILGIGRIAEKPIVDENHAIIACPMMYLCLSYDHRIINGSQAVGALSVMEHALSVCRTDA